MKDYRTVLESRAFEKGYPQVANYIFDAFFELHGDRKSGDDKTITGGLARLEGYKAVAIIYYRGMSANVTSPSGYRKCLRLMNLAEDFNKPVIVFFGVTGVSSLTTLEQQQINESMARYLVKMSSLKVPSVGVVMGKLVESPAVELYAMDRIILLNESKTPNSTPDEVILKNLLDLNIAYRSLDIDTQDDFSSKLREAILEELKQLAKRQMEDPVGHRLKRLQHSF